LSAFIWNISDAWITNAVAASASENSDDAAKISCVGV
jgi:hypothetical protein